MLDFTYLTGASNNRLRELAETELYGRLGLLFEEDTMNKPGKMTREEADNVLRGLLIERGAEYAKAEDHFGDTKTGWWLDGVYLGEHVTDAREAIDG